MNKFEEYKMHIDAVNDIVKKHGKEMATGLIESQFNNHPDLQALLIVGYTPSFNDGDACTHSQYVILSADEILDHISDPEEYIDVSDDDELDPEELFNELNTKLSPNSSKSISEALDAEEELFERVYDTDFQIVAIRKEDGTITIKVEDYDCGY